MSEKNNTGQASSAEQASSAVQASSPVKKNNTGQASSAVQRHKDPRKNRLLQSLVDMLECGCGEKKTCRGKKFRAGWLCLAGRWSTRFREVIILQG